MIQPQFVKPPRTLFEKTGQGTPGAGDRLIKKAEQAVKEHQAKVDYQAIAEGTLERLTQLIQDFAGNPTSDVSRKIFEVCHDLRGEGASFGYPAISRVAELICRVLDCSGQRDRRFLDIVKVEVDSLRALVRFNVKGNPRGTAMELIDALEFLVDAYLGKLKAAA